MLTINKSFDFKTLEEQAYQLFTEGQYKKAESILLQLIERTQNRQQFEDFIDASLLLNRVYINTLEHKLLGENLFNLNSYMNQYATDEQFFLYRLHTAIFNHSYNIGDSLQELENLVNDLYNTNYHQLTVSTSSYLILICLEVREIEKANYYSKKVENRNLEKYFDNPMARFSYYIYSFFGYFGVKNYEKSTAILEIIERTTNFSLISQFGAMYNVAKALQLAQMDDFDTAIQLFDMTYNQMIHKPYIRLALGYWVEQLLRIGLYEKATQYQQLHIKLLEDMYSKEISCLRKQVIEERSKLSYEYLSFQDSLTNCYNRNYYEELIQKNTKFKHYVLVVIDIDLFKMINDTGGHSKGDKAIQAIASELLLFMANYPDGRVVRYGGDEFVLIIPYQYDMIKSELHNLHQSILATSIEMDNVNINLSISMGVSYTNRENCNLQTLFETADKALYEAKETRGAIVTKCLDN